MMSGKNRKSVSKIIVIIMAVLLVLGIFIGIWPLFPEGFLPEGSFFGAVLPVLYTGLSSWVGFFFKGSLESFSLFPFIILLVLLFIDSLRETKFSLVVLQITFFLGAMAFSCGITNSVDSSKPLSVLYQYLRGYVTFLGGEISFLSLVLIVLDSLPKKKVVVQNNGEKITSDVVFDSQNDEVQESNEEQNKESPKEDLLDQIEMMEPLHFTVDETVIPRHEPDEMAPTEEETNEALQALVSTTVPEFTNYANYTLDDVVSSVDVGVFDVVRREAEIRKEEELKRQKEKEERLRREYERMEKEKRERQEAEENRRRLDEIFKPRNLMRRLQEEAQAEKDFRASTISSNIDYGIISSIKEDTREEIIEPK
ncbi:MAG: hypothetical protein HUK24_05815, partial [Sphaerochaetaceae bacterium]|nr:hypothetical protein [Sphaerochaetaceae bacterium]